MFLIKAAFWLSVVILLLPASNASDAGSSDVPEPDVSASEALFAARDAIADLSAFCQRNPEACATGSAALQLFGQKAQNGARMLYVYLAEPDAEADRPEKTHKAAQPGDTLRAEDLEVPWRGPESQS